MLSLAVLQDAIKSLRMFRLKYTIALIAEFASRFGIGERQAYNYLARFKGLAHLSSYYDVIHTQSFDDAVDVMVKVCGHNGGGLR